MRLLPSLFVALFVFVCFRNVQADETNITASINSPEEIKPFGSLRWDDGVFDVITKLNQLSGLNEMSWYEGSDWDKGKSVLGVTKSDDLSKTASAIYDGGFTDTFVDHDGKTVLAPRGTWTTTITAKPISIAGIPFSMTATLQPAPGFAVTYPQKAISVQTDKGIVVLDVVLGEVDLSSDSPTIPEKLDALIAAVKSKYPKGKFDEDKESGLRLGSIDATDETGREFKMTWQSGGGDSKVELDYVEPNSPVNWAEVYQKHLATLEEQTNRPTVDMKSGL